MKEQWDGWRDGEREGWKDGGRSIGWYSLTTRRMAHPERTDILSLHSLVEAASACCVLSPFFRSFLLAQTPFISHPDAVMAPGPSPCLHSLPSSISVPMIPHTCPTMSSYLSGYSLQSKIWLLSTSCRACQGAAPACTCPCPVPQDSRIYTSGHLHVLSLLLSVPCAPHDQSFRTHYGAFSSLPGYWGFPFSAAVVSDAFCNHIVL